MPLVTSVGNSAFLSTKLTNIRVPKVTTIGEYVFYECSWLLSIGDMPSLTIIGNFAFYNCNSLISLGYMSSL